MTDLEYFTPDFFIGNRKRLQDAIGNDAVIVLAGNGLMQRAADEPVVFTQDSNFWYLTGCNEPDVLLVITPSKTFLVAPSLSKERQTFDGSIDVAALAARSGISDIVDEREGTQRLKNITQNTQTIATLGTTPSYIARYRMHILPYRRRLLARLRRLNTTLVIRDIRPELAKARSVKQPAELAALQRAIDITTQTLIDVSKPDVLHAATREYQLEAAISYGFRSRGADGHAFQPIVGAGAHSTTLHHVHNNGVVTPGDMIVLDIGASVEHYAADITRTVSQQPLTTRQQAVFDAVVRIQNYALTLLKPGCMQPAYEKAVVVQTGVELQKLGLITKNTPAQVRRYFPHATSHFLGLDTHDVGNYQEPLVPNMVLTCEPGIYIPEENIGVRLEDDVLITESGNLVLSRACPRSLGRIQ
jgi:Xaa-Pro aminopeptidase